jgi:hypothetical protein
VSLILDALRKLEREKQVPDRGFLVVAPSSWASRGGAGARVLWASVLLAAGAAAALLLTRRPGPQPAPRFVAHVAPAPAKPSLLPAAAPATLPRQPPPWPVTKPTPAAATQSPAPSAAPLVLQAITERDGQPVAMISERMVREGDEIDGVKIVHIGASFVEIETAGERSVLRF